MQERKAGVDNSDDNYSEADNDEASAANRGTVLDRVARDIQS